MSILHKSRDTNLAAQTAFGEAVNTGNLAAFDELVSPSCVDHDPGPGQVPGPEGYRDLFGGMRAAFSDLKVEVEHLVADDDNVAFAYTLTGTHTGPFQGHGPTGRAFSVRGVQISRFADGLMVERWGSTDEIGIMTQLGLLPA
ncbi:ester cyclase [uncultured Friedmanniella sp.]|uniref:ester cyclase n=1 Tax=uncultured Friedmanniella sp. TaxID=335381 RepID=UPI0035CB858E